ncbi:hypothetical protein QNN00_17235 [Bacillus velezensis]|nr:hypothetical protein [Bacillus velezensis]
MKGLVKVAVLTVTLGIGGAFYSSGASAHGYIKSPSQAYMSIRETNIGLDGRAQKYGSVIDNPQSVEGPKDFRSLVRRMEELRLQMGIRTN